MEAMEVLQVLEVLRVMEQVIEELLQLWLRAEAQVIDYFISQLFCSSFGRSIEFIKLFDYNIIYILCNLLFDSLRGSQTVEELVSHCDICSSEVGPTTKWLDLMGRAESESEVRPMNKFMKHLLNIYLQKRSLNFRLISEIETLRKW